MRIIPLAAACAVAALCNVHVARADDSVKEAMGPMYEMQIAPKICGWKDVTNTKKLDAAIADQEKAPCSVMASRSTTGDAEFMQRVLATLRPLAQVSSIVCQTNGVERLNHCVKPADSVTFYKQNRDQDEAR